MARVSQIEKKVRMDNWTIVKFQILTHCYLQKIQVSDADLDCLTLLAIDGAQELTGFCMKVCENGIFKSPQTVRNAISKASRKHLISKEGKNKKRIFLDPAINVQTSGNILLDFKFLSLETQEV